MGLCEHLSRRLVGQAAALQSFSEAVGVAFETPPRPGRALLFALLLGPTGTGKTEMALLAAEHLWGSREALERLDLGEYQHADASVRLLGGVDQEAQLGAALARLNARGGGILLLDELEKAHPTVWPVLLGIDSGRVTMADGTRHDLSRILVLMTSNLGTAEAVRMDAAPDAAVERHILRTAERALRPEVFARFTHKIVTQRLDAPALRSIAALMIRGELAWRERSLLRPIFATEAAARHMAELGLSRELGARPMRHAVERELGRLFSSSEVPARGEGRTRLDLGLVVDAAPEGLVLRVPQTFRATPVPANTQ